MTDGVSYCGNSLFTAANICEPPTRFNLSRIPSTYIPRFVPRLGKINHPSYSSDLDLERRIEYLSLAVSNAKSHPSSEYGQQETAVEFLTDLEDKLEVAQVQLEIANLLSGRYAIETNPDWRRRYEGLTSRLLDISIVSSELKNAPV
jgi:hypothetical protein